MQRTFVTIVLALALTSAVADYTASNYAKAPLPILADAVDSNFTNQSISLSLTLASISSGDLSILGANGTITVPNTSASSWRLWTKKLDGKALTATTTNNSYTVNVGVAPLFVNNYVAGLSISNDTGIPQLWLIQQQLSGGAPLPRVAVSTNTNASYSIGGLAVAVVGKNVYVVYQAAANTLNVTSFVAGGSVGTNEYRLTTAYTDGLQAVWGEAISSSQIFVAWRENEVLKDAVVDVSKGALVGSVNTVGGYQKNYTCSAYVTDKKDYGEICYLVTVSGENSTITYYTRANTTASLTAYVTNNTNTSSYSTNYPYGPYLAVIFTDSVSSKGFSTYHYEIWNLETGVNFKNKTQFLQITTENSTYAPFRVTSGGLYSLLYTAVNSTVPRSNIQVGLLLGGSYLTSVLGFLLTIIAGLLLF